ACARREGSARRRWGGGGGGRGGCAPGRPWGKDERRRRAVSTTGPQGPAVSIPEPLARRMGRGWAEPGAPTRTTRRSAHASHGHREGEQAVGSGRAAGRNDPDRDGQVQSGAGEGRLQVRRRRVQ